MEYRWSRNDVEHPEGLQSLYLFLKLYVIFSYSLTLQRNICHPFLLFVEERRLKLLEYLAAKGRLKPQNDKPYLKDCTNLQNKRPQESSKQICKPKTSAPNKGSHFTFGLSKSKTSSATLLHQSSSGKIPTQPTVSTKRLVSNASSRNPLPPKCGLPRVRPEQRDHAGRTSHPPSVPSAHAKQERREESDVTLTVILTKKDGEKPEICVVDETSPTTGGQCASGLYASVQRKNGEPGVSQSKQVPATKAVTQATKTKSDPKTQPPASKPVSLASSGHIRIVSRLSLPDAKSKSVSERSFLIKSSRYDGSKQPLNVRKSQPVDNSHKTTCPTAKSSSAVAACTMMVHKKISTGPVSAPSRRPHSSDCTSKRISYSQNTQNKPIAPRKSTAPTGCKTVVNGSKDENNEGNREHKQQGVTGATQEVLTKASNLTATDTASRPQTPRMTVEDRKYVKVLI
ncbi:hypothetical protein GDO78_005024 [Eleutherodactylus coqui]|uniref:Uncharacterized protein n=1 Tax=Eleutherodactylus coqui TaxID=57060 RepID=A0A8J6FK39_ELECQ|nr:hypothetical protein GDO78_005024 [Eleutherodactylus coqui]